MTDHQPRRGRYSANLLGTIKSHLEGLQGYEVMALELIQNADDAKAKAVVFDVRDDALYVQNSALFQSCGDVSADECLWDSGEEDSDTCDFHRITDVASGGKLRHKDNIGRFGIGFVSVYQITDHPEIVSSGVHLTLLPEEEGFSETDAGGTEGTVFRLPWATDGRSPARRELRASAVTDDDIAALPVTISRVFQESLLFLRHVNHAELRVNGVARESFRVHRDCESGLVRIEATAERANSSWFVIQADAVENVAPLYEEFPALEELDRSTKVTVAVPLDSDERIEGRFFAYLPTEQTHGLSLHINADFFPEPDRKAIILDGGKHQQAWNAGLIETAAKALAARLLDLREHVGAPRLWGLIYEAYTTFHQPEDPHSHSEFREFWKRLEGALAAAPAIAQDTNASWCAARDLLFTSIGFAPEELSALESVDARIVHTDLVPYGAVLLEAGATPLETESLGLLLENSITLYELQETKVSSTKRQTILEPLWKVLEAVLERENAPRGDQLLNAPLFLTYKNELLTLSEGLQRPDRVSLDRLRVYYPELPLPHPRLEAAEQVLALAPRLGPARVVASLAERFTDPETAASLLPDEVEALKGFYGLLRDLMIGMDREPRAADLETLVTLPILRGGTGYVSASEAFLPGDFEDPIGVAALLELDCYDAETRRFLCEHLAVEEQSLENYIRTQLPEFFAADPPIGKYKKLISELARHSELLESPELTQTLAGLKLVPTRDGQWDTPDRVYKHSDALEKLLGFDPAWWLDERRIPNTRIAESFLLDLGVREVPCAEHVLVVLDNLTAEDPNDEAKKQAEQLFYVICDNFEQWEDEDGEDLEYLENYQESAIFPADGVDDEWFRGDELHAPYRTAAFASQANFPPFKTTQRFSSEAFEFFGFVMEPGTDLVIAHLRHCVNEGLPVSPLTYQVLNERAANEHGAACIATLGDEPCIWSEAKKLYLKPRQLFWASPRLGRFAYTVPRNAETYRRFLEATGVQHEPTPLHYVDIIEQISTEYGEESPLEGENLAVMHSCLRGVSAALSDAEEELRDAASALAELPCIPTLANRLGYSHEVVVADSEWHYEPFGDDVLGMLAPDDAEIRPLYELLEVEPVSAVVSQEIDVISRIQDRADLAQLFAERAPLLVRVLHDQPFDVRSALYGELRKIKVSECQRLQVKHTWSLGDVHFSSDSKPARAFFDAPGQELCVVAPVNARSWAEVLRTIFHALLPHAGGRELPRLIGSAKMVMLAPSTEDAYSELDDLGFPLLPEDWLEQEEVPKSATLDDLPDAEGSGSEGLDGDGDLDPDLQDVETEPAGDEEGTETEDGETRRASEGDPQPTNTDTASRQSANRATERGESPGKNTGNTSGKGATLQGTQPGRDDSRSAPDTSTSHTGHGTGGRTRTRARNAAAAQRRDRLRSYVTRRGEAELRDEKRETEDDGHVLRVEAAARAIVCRYEGRHGRIPEEMPPMNPGFDVKSHDRAGNIVRLIEIKGIDGEWTELGVGLKRRQFSEAWDEGDTFWLYVVEFVFDPKHARVHAIQNPAMKVDEFFFDQNWRGVAESGQDDLRAAFVAGARVRHKGLLGTGTIRERNERGHSVELIIDFDRGGPKALNLNLTQLEVITDEAEPDGDAVS